jgi:hypothetical protein
MKASTFARLAGLGAALLALVSCSKEVAEPIAVSPGSSDQPSAAGVAPAPAQDVPPPRPTLAEHPATASAPRSTAGSPVLHLDYEFPDVFILGEDLRRLREKAERQALCGASRDMLDQIAAIEAEKMRLFEALKADVSKVSASAASADSGFALTLNGIQQDIKRCQSVAKWGLAFTNHEDKIVILNFGPPQVREWETAMREYGVVYPGPRFTWPRLYITNVQAVPDGLRQITAGDWKGAFEVRSGRIFVPGLRYLQDAKRPNGTETRRGPDR